MDEDTVTHTYAVVLGQTAALLETGLSPMEVAACMTQIALGMYRDTLSPEEYNSMCDKISESRHLVKGFLSENTNRNRVLH